MTSIASPIGRRLYDRSYFERDIQFTGGGLALSQPLQDQSKAMNL